MTQQLKNPQYDVFTAFRTRTNSNGLAVMPVAGPFPTSSVIVALHGGIETDTLNYVAVRRGQPPYIPAPYSNNPNRVYLRGAQTGFFPVPEDGGVMNYLTTGFFTFAILSPEGLTSDFMLGTVPFAGVDQDERVPAAYLSSRQLNQLSVKTINGISVPNLASIIRGILQAGGNG